MFFDTQLRYMWELKGYVSSKLFLDLVLVITLRYAVVNVIKPVYRRYKLVQFLEEASGPTKKHCFFGHNKEMPLSQDGILKRCEITSSNPTMFNHWFGPLITALSLHHPDVAVPLLSSGAPKNEMVYRLLRPWIGDGILTSKGKKWQRNRRLLTPAFHFSILKGYSNPMNESTKVLLDKWEAKVDIRFDLFEDVSLMTLDTLLKCAMSSYTNCQLIRDEHPIIRSTKELAKIFNKRILTPYLHPDFIFLRTLIGKRFKHALNVVHSHAEQVIAERQSALQSPQSSNGTSMPCDEASPHKGRKDLDFLDILLHTRDEHGKGLTDKEIRDEVDTFFFAGHDTTSSGISWALYNLAKYPTFQEKCRDEVKTILGDCHLVECKCTKILHTPPNTPTDHILKLNVQLDCELFNKDALSKFEYLTMFIKESLRLYTPVFGSGRKLEEPMTLKSKLNKNYETVIPKGTDCLFAIFALHRNGHVWDKPLEFNPERFTKENIANRSPHAFLPFSAGSRNCIGQNFAMNEIKIALAQTLQRYCLYLDEETPEPIMESLFTLQSKNGIYVKLRRLSQ